MRAEVACASPFTTYGVWVSARVLGGLGVHDLGAVGREFDHLGIGDAIDRVGARDASRVAGHHAAHVGEDLDRFGAQRIAERDRGQIAAAAAERRHRAGCGRALEASHDRNRRRVRARRSDSPDRRAESSLRRMSSSVMMPA